VISARKPQGARVHGHAAPIPDKLYFKIGEVADLVGVQAHVLRYWEKEIPFIRPGKTASNQRRYRRTDVELFREIRRLLHQERYTLAGARKRLLSGERGEDALGPASPTADGVPANHSGNESATPALPAVNSEVENARRMRLRDGLLELIQMAEQKSPQDLNRE
jgi:DNA-binding transcriptional MerR regulator